jgi:hypothetical protein
MAVPPQVRISTVRLVRRASTPKLGPAQAPGGAQTPPPAHLWDRRRPRGEIPPGRMGAWSVQSRRMEINWSRLTRPCTHLFSSVPVGITVRRAGRPSLRSPLWWVLSYRRCAVVRLLHCPERSAMIVQRTPAQDLSQRDEAPVLASAQSGVRERLDQLVYWVCLRCWARRPFLRRDPSVVVADGGRSRWSSRRCA